MPDKKDDDNVKDGDNVEYLFRKPGFYKKGPLDFCLYFGTLEELVDEAMAGPDLKPVTGNPDEGPDQAA